MSQIAAILEAIASLAKAIVYFFKKDAKTPEQQDAEIAKEIADQKNNAEKKGKPQ
jgi:hypothetical protein